jgi:predicted RNase H-like HicB family nuclease
MAETERSYSMARYAALLDFYDEQYGVVFPDIPGCVAMAGSHEAAIVEAADALAEWVADELAQGRTVPTPRTVAELLTDADVKAALANGAVLASVPLVLETGRSARANISIDEGLLAGIDEAARLHGVTRSAFLAAAARDKIKASV